MRTRTYKCEDCGSQDEFSSYKKARAASWAVAADYKKCYCPRCAPEHRRGAAIKEQDVSLSFGWKQLTIDLN